MSALGGYVLPGAVVLAALAATWFLTGDSGTANAKRVRAVAGAGPGEQKRGARGPDAGAARRRQVQENLKQLSEDQRASRRQLRTLRSRLTQAGIEIEPPVFWIVSLIFGVLLTGAVYFSGLNIELIPFSRYLLLGAAAFIGGIGAPRWVIGFLISGRQTKFSHQFADALEVMVRGIRSGLPLGECLQIVAREGSEPLKSEFMNITDNMAMGVTIDAATARLYERMPLQEVNFFQIVLVIQARSGGNLTEALANLAAVLRARKLMKEKIKALSSEAVASAGIIGSLPPGVMALVYLTTPKYISLLFTTALGNLFLVIGLATMGTGIFIMRKMVSFDF